MSGWIGEPTVRRDTDSVVLIEQDVQIGTVRGWESWRVEFDRDEQVVRISDRGDGPASIPLHVLPLVLQALEAVAGAQQAGAFCPGI